MPKRCAGKLCVFLLTTAWIVSPPAARAASPTEPDAATRVARKLAADISRSVARIRGLPLRRPLKVGVYDATALRAFVLRQIDQAGGARYLANLGRALMQFGLVPPGSSLRDTYVKLLAAQVAGLYDPASKELRVMRKLVPVGVQLPNPLHALTGSPEDQLRFVMAHEIVHALQDQRWDLRRLTRDRRGQTDLETALASLLEGDATLGGLLWAMEDRQGAADLQAILAAGPAMQRVLNGALSLAKVGLLPGGAGLAEASPFLQERLVVPYSAGLGLCMAAAGRRMTGKNGRSAQAGMAGVDALYATPPLSMEQVLHPEKLWGGTPGQAPDYPIVLKLPDVRALLGRGARRLYTDDLGELYIRRLLRAAMAETQADRAAAGWGGDRYALYKTPHGDAVVWLTTWDTTDDALEFAAAAKQWLRTVAGARPAMDGILHRGRDVLVWRGLPAKVATRVGGRVLKRTRRTVRRRLPR